jgi:hypothetical protein
LTELEFLAYGRLYLKSSRIDTSFYMHLEDEFYIGPYCGAMFWQALLGDRISSMPRHRARVMDHVSTNYL